MIERYYDNKEKPVASTSEHEAQSWWQYKQKKNLMESVHWRTMKIIAGLHKVPYEYNTDIYIYMKVSKKHMPRCYINTFLVVVCYINTVCLNFLDPVTTKEMEID